jgi:hypothetical protein
MSTRFWDAQHTWKSLGTLRDAEYRRGKVRLCSKQTLLGSSRSRHVLVWLAIYEMVTRDRVVVKAVVF